MGVHEFFSQRSMMQEHRKKPTKQAQRQRQLECNKIFFESVLNLNEEALM
jgi:hypothetical protein